MVQGTLYRELAEFTVTRSDKQPITDVVQWTTSDPCINVSPEKAGGVGQCNLSCTGVHNTTQTATVDGLTGTASLTCDIQ